MPKGTIYPQDLLALIVVLFGALGFFLWGLGIQFPANPTLQWLGGSIVAMIAFIATFFTRWFK